MMHIPFSLKYAFPFYKQRSKDKIFLPHPVAWLTIFYVFLYVQTAIDVIEHNNQQNKKLNGITSIKNSVLPAG